MPAVSIRSFAPQGMRDDAAQLRIEAFQPVEIHAGESIGGELALFDPARELRQRGEGDGIVTFG
jgi:hypothetical protein